jgi:hypothetical protein
MLHVPQKRAFKPCSQASGKHCSSAQLYQFMSPVDVVACSFGNELALEVWILIQDVVLYSWHTLPFLYQTLISLSQFPFWQFVISSYQITYDWWLSEITSKGAMIPEIVSNSWLLENQYQQIPTDNCSYTCMGIIHFMVALLTPVTYVVSDRVPYFLHSMTASNY